MSVLAATFLAASASTTMGHRGADAPMAPSPRAAPRFRLHLIASPFGTIDPATYTYARPIGTAMPRPPRYLLASFEAASADAAARPDDDGPSAASAAIAAAYPTVNRRLKGDRLPLPKTVPGSTKPENRPHSASATTRPTSQSGRLAAPSADAKAPTRVVTITIKAHPISTAHRPLDVPAAGNLDAAAGPDSPRALAGKDSIKRDAHIYFDSADFGPPGTLKPWAKGAAPMRAKDAAESGIKAAAVEGTKDAGPGGETVARKDDPDRPESPAQRLGLAGKARAKARKCLAQAIYFEARGEPYRGQEAVAQVVMNRVFSGYYPRNVCGVVFQNAHHYLACQFTFACEHKNLNRIDEPEMWAQAERIADNALDGKFWLADIGHATHYHAYWVHPRWVHEMKRLDKLGGHTFYRPRAWGSGDDEPVWGPTARRTSQPGARNANRQAQAAGAGSDTADD